MNVSTVNDNQAWDKFATLAQAARVRNAGFNVPLASRRDSVSEGRRGYRTQMNSGIKNVNRYYNKPNMIERNRVVKGGRFDAYA